MSWLKVSEVKFSCSSANWPSKSTANQLSKIDIGKIMPSKDPAVKCVLLRAALSCDKGEGLRRHGLSCR